MSTYTIFHDLPVDAPAQKIFDHVSDPLLLNKWWTESCEGHAETNAVYTLGFTSEYIWKARVSRCSPGKLFELEMTESDADWDGTKVGFVISEKENTCWLRFYHTGWRETNDHYRISSFCWAMYLRLLKQSIEKNIFVPYADRLSV